jgi:hypothetical protein
VGQVFREQFKRVGLDLVISLPKLFDLFSVRTILSQVDLVIINGEGSIHHGRNLHLLELANQFPSILVNCVYQENPTIDAIRNFKYLTARESLSAAEITKTGAECSVVPDMIFGSSLVWSYHREAAKNDIGVTDSVIKEYKGLRILKRKVSHDITAHDHTPGSIMNKLSSYQRICAGRFHAAIIATILDIPFSAWESNSWKIQGWMKDMGLSELCFGTRAEALSSIPLTPDPKMKTFALSARTKVDESFDRVKQIAAG